MCALDDFLVLSAPVLRQIAHYLPHHRSENASKTHPKSAHDKFKTASKPAEQSSLNYFASAWCALENMLLAATAEGLGAVFHIPVNDEADKIKAIIYAPEDYEMTCLLTIGYPVENAFLPKQKEINIESRIHKNNVRGLLFLKINHIRK